MATPYSLQILNFEIHVRSYGCCVCIFSAPFGLRNIERIDNL